MSMDLRRRITEIRPFRHAQTSGDDSFSRAGAAIKTILIANGEIKPAKEIIFMPAWGVKGVKAIIWMGIWELASAFAQVALFRKRERYCSDLAATLLLFLRFVGSDIPGSCPDNQTRVSDTMSPVFDKGIKCSHAGLVLQGS